MKLFQRFRQCHCTEKGIDEMSETAVR